MIEMVRALLYLKNNTEYKDDVTVDFDDSIIEDSTEIQRRALLELNSGVIDKVEYIMQVYKYTEDQAKEFVDEIDNRILEEQKKITPKEPDLEDEI